MSELGEILAGHTAAIMDGHAVIAEAAATDLRINGLTATALEAVAQSYRQAAADAKAGK